MVTGTHWKRAGSRSRLSVRSSEDFHWATTRSRRSGPAFRLNTRRMYRRLASSASNMPSHRRIISGMANWRRVWPLGAVSTTMQS